MKGKTCCVTGHRDLPQNEINKIKTALAHEIDAAVTDGFTCFMSGFADGVDQYFVELVLERKQTTPALELIAVIPYRKRLDSLNKKTRTRELLEACADVVVIQEKYLPSVYSHRNRYMVEHSDRVIAVYDGRETGGIAKTIRFTHRMKKELREIPVGEIVMITGPIDTILNIILFVPLGFFLPLLYKKYHHMKTVALTGFLFSLAVEIVQMFGWGSSDINDLMTNTAGACIGFLVYCLLSRILPANLKKQLQSSRVNAVAEVLLFAICTFAIMVTAQTWFVHDVLNVP